MGISSKCFTIAVSACREILKWNPVYVGILEDKFDYCTHFPPLAYKLSSVIWAEVRRCCYTGCRLSLNIVDD